jgi:hypothetical protein
MKIMKEILSDVSPVSSYKELHDSSEMALTFLHITSTIKFWNLRMNMLRL